MSKNVQFAVTRCVLSSSKRNKTCFWPGLRHGPRLGAYDAPPDPLVGWGGETPPIGGGKPPPHYPPLDAFGVSNLGAHSTPLTSTPSTTKSWLRLCSRSNLHQTTAQPLANPARYIAPRKATQAMQCLADRTVALMLQCCVRHLSVVCDVMYCG